MIRDLRGLVAVIVVTALFFHPAPRQSAAQDLTLDSAIEIVRSQLGQRTSRHLEWEEKSRWDYWETGKWSIMKGEVWHSSLERPFARVFRARSLSDINPGSGGKYKNEWLFHSDGLASSCRESYEENKDQEGEPSLVSHVVTGIEAWHTSRNASELIILGRIWTGRQYQYLFDDEIYSQAEIIKDNSRDVLRLNLPEGVFVDYSFESINGSPDHRIQSQLVWYPRDNSFGRYKSLRAHEARFRYTDDTSTRLAGWTIIDTSVDKQGKEQPKYDRSFTILSDSEWIPPADFRLQFELLKVRDLEPVRVAGYEGIGFVYHDGRFEKGIDRDSFELIYETWQHQQNGDNAAPKPEERGFVLTSAPYAASNSQCGSYSLAIAAAKLGTWIPIDELADRQAFRHALGVSAGGLVQAARDYGLHPQYVSNLDVRTLRKLGQPAILHYGELVDGSGAFHWVAYLGEGESASDLVIADLPNAPGPVNGAELLTHWDGSAILLYSEQPAGYELTQSRLHVFLLPLLIVLPLILVFEKLVWRRRVAKGGWKMAAYRVPLFFVIVFIATLCWASWSATSYFNNGTAVAISRSKVPLLESDINKTDQFPDEETIEEDKICVVDARMAETFARGLNIPGAVNLPINADLGTLKHVVEQIQTEGNILVYCSNSECGWAEQIGLRLKALGCRNVTVYTPGFRGYQSQQRMDGR